MPWNLLLLPLIGGYYVLSRSNLYKYTQQRLDRQRLIFDSIVAGFVLLMIGFVLRLLVLLIPGVAQWYYQHTPLEIPYLVTGLSSFVLGVLFAELGNKFIYTDRNVYIERGIERVGTQLDLLLNTSVRKSILLEFTLDTSKVYVAWVKELPIPTVTNYIRVIPVISGYRDSQLRLHFTTHYLSVYSEYVKEGKIKGVEELDVDLIITVDNIVTVSYFDLDMYERFQKPIEQEERPDVKA